MNAYRLRPRRILPLPAMTLLIAGCAGSVDNGDGPPARPVDLSRVPDAVPRVEAPSRYGNPSSYTVRGKRYVTLRSAAGYRKKGIASWYGRKFHGRLTSNREHYDMYAMSAAHRSLPLPTYARVTHLKNNRVVVVRINDRGPFHANRIIDLSYAAAAKLGIDRSGTGLVEVIALEPGADPAAAISATTADDEAPEKAHEPVLFLQIGAFAERANAERMRRRALAGIDEVIRIQTLSGNPHLLYRVQIGPLDGVDTVDRLTEALRPLGIDDTRVVIE